MYTASTYAVLALGCVGTGVLLWLLLRPYGPARASAFALLRTVEAAVIIAGALPMVVLLRLPTQIRAATIPLEHLHDAAFLLGQGLVISVNTIILGWLLFDASVVPRALATLGVTGGAIVLASNLAPWPPCVRSLCSASSCGWRPSSSCGASGRRRTPDGRPSGDRKSGTSGAAVRPIPRRAGGRSSQVRSRRAGPARRRGW